MSELTLCNYCNWRYYKSRYGEKVELRDKVTDRGWMDFKESYPNSKFVVLEGNVIGWFMNLTDCCVC